MLRANRLFFCSILAVLTACSDSSNTVFISPPKELLGKPFHGIELRISIALDSDKGTYVNGTPGILATVILKNESTGAIAFRDDFNKGGPFDFVSLDASGNYSDLSKPIDPTTENVSGRLEQLKSGESRQYEQRISAQFLPLIIQGQVIGRFKFWENADQITVEVLKKEQSTVWSNSARLDLKRKKCDRTAQVGK